jgi:alpha-mannosidase
LKQETREIEQELLTAEKLQGIASWLGKVDNYNLMQAWEPVLFNQTHDLASGVMTDHVYLDVQRGYDFARRSAALESKSDSEMLLKHINTIGSGSPIVVFNPSGWVRTDAVEANIGFTNFTTFDLRVTDANGLSVPCEVTSADHNPNGSLLRATVLFVAKDLAALGYSTYHITAAPRRTFAAAPTARDTSDVLENEFFRVTVSRTTGAITSLFDKTQQWEALSAPANVIAEQEDKGDFWELYHGLNGAQAIVMTNKQPVPDGTNSKLSTDAEGKDASIVRTPVYSEFKVSHPFGNGAFATRIRLYAGVRRVDIQTELTNNDKLVRYQALFPTSVTNGRYFQEIPFGAVERSIGVEYPAQNWTDFSDNLHGVTLINHGMPGNLVNDGTLMLSLMRSHTIGGYGFGGGFEPGMTSDSGYELNHPLQFNYALAPHSGSWQESAVREGFEFNQPLQVWKTDVHSGILPPSRSMISISNPDVILTAFKPGAGHSVIVRFYESAGLPAKGVTIKIDATLLSAHESNLMEDAGRALAIANNTLKIDLKPFEIKTIKLKIADLQVNPIKVAQ